MEAVRVQVWNGNVDDPMFSKDGGDLFFLPVLLPSAPHAGDMIMLGDFIEIMPEFSREYKDRVNAYGWVVKTTTWAFDKRGPYVRIYIEGE
ncbi:hypothetical protein GCM10027299_21770 [Larkinella ripae]